MIFLSVKAMFSSRHRQDVQIRFPAAASSRPEPKHGENDRNDQKGQEKPEGKTMVFLGFSVVFLGFSTFSELDLTENSAWLLGDFA